MLATKRRPELSIRNGGVAVAIVLPELAPIVLSAANKPSLFGMAATKPHAFSRDSPPTLTSKVFKPFFKVIVLRSAFHP